MRQFTKRVLKALLSVLMCFSVLQIPRTGIEVVRAEDEVTPPQNSKYLHDNGDGTYKLVLTVTGESEKKVTKTNVIVILDRSGSMNTQRMTAAKNAVNSLAQTLLGFNGQDGNPNDTFELALITFSNVATISQNPTTNYTTFSAAVNRVNAEGGTNWEDALQEVMNVDFGDNDQTFVIFVSDGNPTFRNTEGNYPNHNNDYNADYYRQYGVWGSGSDSSNTTVTRCYEHAVDDAQAIVNAGMTLYTIGAYGNVDRMQDLTTDAGAPAGNYYSAANSEQLNAAIAEIMENIQRAGISDVTIDDPTTSYVATSSAEVSHLLGVDADSFQYYRSGSPYSTTANPLTVTGDAGTVILGDQWTDVPPAAQATVDSQGKVSWTLDTTTLGGPLENGVTYAVTFDVYPSQETLDIIADVKNNPAHYDELDPAIQQYIDRNGNLKTNKTATISWKDTREDPATQHTAEIVNPDPVDTTSVESLVVAKEWQNELDGREAAPINMNVTRDGHNQYLVRLASDNTPTPWSSSVYISIGIMTIHDGVVSVKASGHDYTFSEPDNMAYYWELDVPVVHPMLINDKKTLLFKIDESEAPASLVSATAPATAESGSKTYYKLAWSNEYGSFNGYYVVDDSINANSLTATNFRRSALNLTKAVVGADADPDTLFDFTVKVKDSKADDPSSTDTNSDNYVWFSIKESNDPNKLDFIINDSQNTYITGATPETATYRTGETPYGTVESITVAEQDNGYILTLHYAASEDDEGNVIPAYTYDVKAADYTVADGVYTVYTGYYYAKSEAEIGVKLKAGWNLRFLNLPSESTYTFTEGTLPESYAFDKSELTVGEDSTFSDGQTTTGTIENTNTDYTVKFTNEFTLINIEVTKKWEDNNNQDGKRPETVTFVLYKNGEATDKTVELDGTTDEATTGDRENAAWKVLFENLPKYENGEEITWTVKELSAAEAPLANGDSFDDNYVVSYENEEDFAVDDGTITNTHTPEKRSVTITKIWDDAEYQTVTGYSRPSSIVLTLNGTDDSSRDATLTARNADSSDSSRWSYTFTDLPVYAAGKEITYTVSEEQLDGYNEPVINQTALTVTNTPTRIITYNPLELKIIKIDANTEHGLVGAVFTLTDSTDSTKTWSYTTASDGIVIITFDPDEAALPGKGTFTLTETTVPTGYQQNNTTWKVVVEEGEVVSVTQVDGVWDWLHDLIFGDETDYDPELGILTVPNTPTTTTVNVEKIWDDESNKNSTRPTSVVYQLYKRVNGTPSAVTGKTLTLNGSGNTWTGSFTDLPAYEDGYEVTYYIREMNEIGRAHV